MIAIHVKILVQQNVRVYLVIVLKKQPENVWRDAVKSAETMEEIHKTVNWKQLKSATDLVHYQPVSNQIVHQTRVASLLSWLAVKLFQSQQNPIGHNAMHCVTISVKVWDTLQTL